ncbi:MAG: hypothetical protein ABF968_06065, partial [Acetobacter sp.]|uniref:hypothetical protein n=1 Tax=Acetobacter sp. TaxID=440 RepID=UPI0039EC7D4E
NNYTQSLKRQFLPHHNSQNHIKMYRSDLSLTTTIQTILARSLFIEERKHSCRIIMKLFRTTQASIKNGTSPFYVSGCQML